MPDTIARRTFTQNLVASIASGVVTGATCDGSEAEKINPTEQLLAVLQSQFRDRFSDTEWLEIRRKLEWQEISRQTLSQFQLCNSDEPATVFSAYRESVKACES